MPKINFTKKESEVQKLKDRIMLGITEIEHKNVGKVEDKLIRVWESEIQKVINNA